MFRWRCLSLFGLKEQRQLMHVELVLGVDDFHGQTAVADLVLADTKNARLLLGLRATVVEQRQRQ